MADLPEELKQSLSALIDQAHELGYDLDLDSHDGRSLFIGFLKRYDPFHKDSRPEWVSGEELLKRWKMEAQTLVFRLAGSHEPQAFGLPIYLWSIKTNEMEPVNFRIPQLSDLFPPPESPNISSNLNLDPKLLKLMKDLFNKKSSLPKELEPVVWCTIPQWWWLNRADVEFYEKVDPQLRKKVSPLTPNWKLAEEVQKRWSIGPSELKDLVTDKGLRAWRLYFVQGIILADKEYLDGAPLEYGYGSLMTRLDSCMFKTSHVKAFENRREKYKNRRKKQEQKANAEKLIVDEASRLKEAHPNWGVGEVTDKTMKHFSPEDRRIPSNWGWGRNKFYYVIRNALFAELKGIKGGRFRKSTR